MAKDSVVYNKLVRDRIPDLIRAQGEVPMVRVRDEAEYRQALRQKLREEVAEYLESGEAEELADVLEVVYALAVAQDMSPEALEALRAEKWAKCGGFEKRLLLEEKRSGE